MNRVLIGLGVLIVAVCGLFTVASSVSAEESTTIAVTDIVQMSDVGTSLLTSATSTQPLESKASASFMCRCLDEPGNSAWSKKNEVKCDKAISKAIGVRNWKKVNLSKPPYKRKWDALVAQCD